MKHRYLYANGHWLQFKNKIQNVHKALCGFTNPMVFTNLIYFESEQTLIMTQQNLQTADD